MSPIQRIVHRQRKVHRYYKITGGYKFIGKNLLRLLGFALGFILIAWAFDKYIFSFNTVTDYLVTHFSTGTIIFWFFVSELAMSILAPEAFMIWVNSLDKAWLVITLMAILSYAAGLITYWIGTRLHKVPKVHNWVDIRFNEQKIQLHRYGGLFIALGALTPLPYGIINLMCGLAEVRFRFFVLIALFRFVRIFGSFAIISLF